MGLLNILGNIFGIGKDYLKNRAELKKLKRKQEHEIIKAETDAMVSRIKNNTESDNEIDIITARNKKYTLKDDVIVYLFLIPIFVANITPFLVAYQNKDWTELNQYIKNSYISLDNLPNWYKYVLGAVIVDTIGMRSFFRKIFNTYIDKKYNKDDKENK